ncbi:MAG: hypothetical protein LUG60_12935 [Erysipelotrichaceae bacterium]|nr:hypothetical protein [Erysipelotrichaceae bacterium]
MEKMNQYEKAYQDAIGTRITKAKAIRLKCLDCCAYQANEVKLCVCTDCPLWRYRMGHEERDTLYYEYQSNKKPMSEEVKERLRNL